MLSLALSRTLSCFLAHSRAPSRPLALPRACSPSRALSRAPSFSLALPRALARPRALFRAPCISAPLPGRWALALAACPLAPGTGGLAAGCRTPATGSWLPARPLLLPFPLPL